MKSRKNIKETALINAKELMDTKMPRNTNFYSETARHKISELIVEMIFKKFLVKKKSESMLKRLKGESQID